ncbi:MAG: hypothetical protein M0R17_09435 [Candidatus Omnitrophica bacterium]|jgi:hypothetical protein|nr:hypothetical protein [Candidatus Omnitrophota bacterium]
MIEVKFKKEDKWEYKTFENQKQLDDFLKVNEGIYSEYKIKPKKTIKSLFLNWWRNIRNTKKNWNKVRASPFASLTLAYKARKIIIGLLIPYLIYMTFKMVKNYAAVGLMGTIGKAFMIGIMAFICWKIYQTIPMAKKKIDYYKKYPHTINYCPANTKETVDDILKKIEENQDKEKGGLKV